MNENLGGGVYANPIRKWAFLGGSGAFPGRRVAPALSKEYSVSFPRVSENWNTS